LEIARHVMQYLPTQKLLLAKGRFPDIAKLKAAIADQKVFSPETIMPPFGRNKILTPEQIDVIAQYIYQY